MSGEDIARVAECLEVVDTLRQARTANPALAERVLCLKDYQAQRFRRTYADLLADPRHAAAARFFLDELYGPQDFAQRDAQFGRVAPKIARVFPGEMVGTIARLAELHALSERFDQAMAARLPSLKNGSNGHNRPKEPIGPIQPLDYLLAWQDVGDEPARRRQIELTLGIGQALEGYTRSRLVHATLRLMRRPAQAAGFGALQHFLEAGFDAFASMHGSNEFLSTVALRESRLMDALFDPMARTRLAVRGNTAPEAGPLGDLPG